MFDLTDRRVAVVRCTEYTPEALNNALDQIFSAFPMADAVRGKSVLIKANLLTAHAPERAATTHPALVSALAKRLYDWGAVRVIIGDSPGGVFTKNAVQAVYDATGMTQAAKESGAFLNDDFTESDVCRGTRHDAMRLASYVSSADVVISVAKLKTHTYARMTGAVKNLYGAVAGLEKAKYYAKIPERAAFASLLADICETVAPDLSIIDGILGMEGNGPGTGDPKKADLLLASPNPFCADLAAAAVIGMDAARVPSIAEGIRRGYSPENADQLEIIGLSLADAFVRFVPPPYMGNTGFAALLPDFIRKPIARFREPYPIVTDLCVGCGECARACPKHTIRITDGRAKIDQSQCIQCFCCHEMCRMKAIRLKRSLRRPRS